MYSALPHGLTEGVDALAFPHANNWAYSGTTTSGSPSLLRDAIALRSSWRSSNTNAFNTGVTTFTVLPEPPAAPPIMPPVPPPPQLPPAPPHPPSMPPSLPAAEIGFTSADNDGWTTGNGSGPPF
eukprot:5159791-Prymnesium_polylepis.1